MPDLQTSTGETAAAHLWDERERRRALRAWIVRSTTASFASQSFLVYYLKELNASDQLLGWAFAFPTFATAAQFLGSAWAERTPSRRGLCVRFYMAQVVCWVVILALGAWAAADPQRYGVMRVSFVVLTSVAALLLHLQNPSWDSWFSDAVENQHKSHFFGQWGLWTGILACVVGLGGGWLVEVVARGRSSQVFQWMILVLLAGNALCLLGAGLMYRRLREVPTRSESLGFRELVKVALSQRNYMLFITMYSVRILAISVYAVFAISWFKDDLKMGIFFLGFITAIHQVLVAVASPLWSVLVKRFGGKPVLWFGTIITALHPLAYFFYTPENYRWLAPVHWGLLGFLLASYTVAVNTLWYGLPSQRARSMQFALAWMAFGVTGAVGSALGGWLATNAPAVSIGRFTWSHYHWLFLVAIVLHVPCFILLAKIKEEGAYSPRIMAMWLLRRVTNRRIG